MLTLYVFSESEHVQTLSLFPLLDSFCFLCLIASVLSQEAQGTEEDEKHYDGW